MAIHPEVLWAQRSSETEEKTNVVYVTINLPDIQESTLKCDLTATSISFAAKTGNAGKGIEEKDYAFSLDFYSEIDPENSTKHLTTRSLALVIRKKEKKLEYWPRLTKEKIKISFIKTDFDKWVDEEEQEGAPKVDDDDFDMGGMGGMGGMPGMGGMGGMPGMGGMGGMPGMGGMGGMPGMGGMGGMPGMGDMGDMGDMDFSKMMSAMGKNGGDDAPGADSDSDDDGPPPLEEAEPAK